MEKLHCPCILNLIFYKLFFNEWCNYLAVYLFSLKDQWIYRFLIWYDICYVNLYVGPTQPVDAIYLYIYSKTCYRIFGNVHMILFSLFSQSLLHRKIIITQKLYPVLFAIRKFKNRKKWPRQIKKVAHFPKFYKYCHTRKMLHIRYICMYPCYNWLFCPLIAVVTGASWVFGI